MIKKITLIILLFCAIISCGKKSDPEYKESRIIKSIQLLLINKA